MEAVATVHRLVAARIEWNFGNVPAVAARRLEHFARTSAAAFAHAHAAAVLRAHCFARRAAIRTTVGLVLEAFLLVELLFTGAKYELAAAIHTVQHFIYVHETRNSLDSAHGVDLECEATENPTT